MEQVINGKIYSTETATLIDDYEYGNGFNHIQEGLYITKNKTFFTAGHGGALSKYGVYVNDSTKVGSSRIEVLFTERAREWCESRQVDVNKMKKYFDLSEG